MLPVVVSQQTHLWLCGAPFSNINLCDHKLSPACRQSVKYLKKKEKFDLDIRKNNDPIKETFSTV